MAKELTGDEVYTNLMDLDLLLQDVYKMGTLKLFLGTIKPGNPALGQLNAQIVGLTERMTRLLEVIQKK